eukprot:5773715-Amphidinium_carterae.1
MALLGCLCERSIISPCHALATCVASEAGVLKNVTRTSVPFKPFDPTRVLPLTCRLSRTDNQESGPTGDVVKSAPILFEGVVPLCWASSGEREADGREPDSGQPLS